MRLLGEERDAPVCVVTLNAAPLRAVPTAGFPSLAMAKISGVGDRTPLNAACLGGWRPPHWRWGSAL